VAKEAVSRTSCGTALRRFELRDGNIGRPGQNLRAGKKLRRLRRERNGPVEKGSSELQALLAQLRQLDLTQ
jgi:hypothetical protein